MIWSLQQKLRALFFADSNLPFQKKLLPLQVALSTNFRKTT